MNKTEMAALLTAEARAALRTMFRGNRERKALLMRVAAGVFTGDEVPRLSALLAGPGFAAFARRRMRTSASRYEQSLGVLFARIAAGIDPADVDAIAHAMSSDGYRAIERSFFKVPVDRESYELFEKNFVTVGEQNAGLLEDYIALCSSPEFILFKADYRRTPALYPDMFGRLAALLLARGQAAARRAAAHLSSPAVLDLVAMALLTGTADRLVNDLFDVFFRVPDPEMFFRLLDIFHGRYRGMPADNPAAAGIVLQRLADARPVMLAAGEGGQKQFREFLLRYGDPRDDFGQFVWEVVFGLEPGKAAKAMGIMVSTAFGSLRGYYSADPAVMKFLARSIVAAISEMEVRDLSGPLHRVVLKLLLGLKLDRQFLRRRADFFSWMRKQSSSARLEAEVIRFMFFEYLYIAAGAVENTRDMRMTKFCDGTHRFFCRMLDEVYGKRAFLREKPDQDPFASVLERVRSAVWAPCFEKFPPFAYRLEELKGIAESTDREDGVLAALESMDAAGLESYHEALMDAFRGDPGRIDEAILPDFWYRLPFADAAPYCQETLLPVIGTARIEVSPRGVACTDGRSIFLPPFVNNFRDRPEPIIRNRNLTMYIAMTLHEAGHILGGSYHFNMNTFLGKVERPDLFKEIWNTFEDFRIESFMVKIGAHPQAADMFRVMNEFFSADGIGLAYPMGIFFLLYVFDEAGGYNRAFRDDPRYSAKVEATLGRAVNTGRFRGLADMAAYGTERLRGLDVANPLAAYQLAREFYEIMKLWPDSDLRGLLSPEYRRGRGENDGELFRTGGT